MPNPSGTYIIFEKDVGTTEVQVHHISFSLAFGILVKADPDNTGIIYVGKKGVTVAGGAAPGFPLSAGEAIEIEIDNFTKIYLLSDTAAQKAWVVAL